MNFKTDKNELNRALDIVGLMTQSESFRFLTTRDIQGYYAPQIAQALGLEVRGKFVSVLAVEIHKLVHQGGVSADQPVVPKGPFCDGCGGIGDTPKFLRWAKVARGEPITLSVDEANKPATLHWLTPEIILKEWFEFWVPGTALKFKLITTGKADIRGRYAPIDGPGGTRGMAWLPDQSIDFMEQGGDLSGDFVIDSSDRWTTVEEVHETGSHEGGHCLGMPHTNNPADVLYPYATGKRRPRSTNDNLAITGRYPPIGIPA